MDYKNVKFMAKIEKDGKINKYPVGIFNGKIIISTTIPYYGQAFVELTEEYGELIEIWEVYNGES